MHQGQEGVEAAAEVLPGDPVDRVQLVGGADPPPAQVPLPAADLRDALGLGEHAAALPDLLEEAPPVGVVRDRVEVALHGAVLVVQRALADQHPHLLAVAAVPEALHLRLVDPALGQVLQVRGHLGAAGLVERVEEGQRGELGLVDAEQVGHRPVGVQGAPGTVEDPDPVQGCLDDALVQRPELHVPSWGTRLRPCHGFRHELFTMSELRAGTVLSATTASTAVTAKA